MVSFEWSPSSVVHTPSSRPCTGCSKCVDCKQKELPVYPFYDTMKPGTFNNDLQKQVTVQRQETRTTDTNENVFQKGDKCFYKSKHGPFEEAIIENVDNSVNPPSYAVRILPRVKDTTAEKLYREVPDHGEVSNDGSLHDDSPHEMEFKHIVAENRGPWNQSKNELNNQIKSRLHGCSRVQYQGNNMKKHDVVEPEYPEADYGCMSLKSLYQ